MASIVPDVHVKAAYWLFGTPLPYAQSLGRLTHLYVGGALKVNPDTGAVIIPDPNVEREFQNFTKSTIQKLNPLQFVFSIGGEDSAADISAMIRDENKRARFIRDSIELANIDTILIVGLDLCWLYPSPSDKPADLVSFLTEWRDAVEKEAVRKDLRLTAAVFHHPVIPCTGGTFNYPCYTINEKLDWINVMAIDFYTPSNSPAMTGPVHAWHTRPEDLGRCGSDGIGHWVNNRVAKQKLVLCLPFYGYEWILDDPNNSGFFAPARRASFLPIPYRKIKQLPYIDHHDDEYIAAYKHNSDSWIGYENEVTIPEKVKVAIRKNNLGGYVAWDLGADDESWTLLSAVFNA